MNYCKELERLCAEYARDLMQFVLTAKNIDATCGLNDENNLVMSGSYKNEEDAEFTKILLGKVAALMVSSEFYGQDKKREELRRIAWNSMTDEQRAYIKAKNTVDKWLKESGLKS